MIAEDPAAVSVTSTAAGSSTSDLAMYSTRSFIRAYQSGIVRFSATIQPHQARRLRLLRRLLELRLRLVLLLRLAPASSLRQARQPQWVQERAYQQRQRLFRLWHRACQRATRAVSGRSARGVRPWQLHLRQRAFPSFHPCATVPGVRWCRASPECAVRIRSVERLHSANTERDLPGCPW